MLGGVAKIRHQTVSGGEPEEVPSRSRRTKPPAKAIHGRTAAALRTGGKIPPKVRAAMEELPSRTKPTEGKGPEQGGVRAGKRVPRRAKKGLPGPIGSLPRPGRPGPAKPPTKRGERSGQKTARRDMERGVTSRARKSEQGKERRPDPRAGGRPGRPRSKWGPGKPRTR